MANRQGTTLSYIMQDHLGSTSITADSSGTQIAALAYYPWGGTRTSSGDLSTDKKFTGQRLDNTGLYYYGARYYDPAIGRFISPDTIVQDYNNPQSLNRYTYVLNNPLKYTDPTGHIFNVVIGALIGAACYAAQRAAVAAVQHSEEGTLRAILNHTFDNWDNSNFILSVALGAATGGISGVALQLAKTGAITAAETALTVTGCTAAAAAIDTNYAINTQQINNTSEEILQNYVNDLLSGSIGEVNPVLSIGYEGVSNYYYAQKTYSNSHSSQYSQQKGCEVLTEAGKWVTLSSEQVAKLDSSKPYGEQLQP